MRHRHAAQHQRALRDQPVDIVAESDAHAAAQQPFRHRQITRTRDFEIHRFAFDKMDAMSGAFHHRGIVRDRPFFRQRLPIGRATTGDI